MTPHFCKLVHIYSFHLSHPSYNLYLCSSRSSSDTIFTQNFVRKSWFTHSSTHFLLSDFRLSHLQFIPYYLPVIISQLFPKKIRVQIVSRRFTSFLLSYHSFLYSFHLTLPLQLHSPSGLHPPSFFPRLRSSSRSTYCHCNVPSVIPYSLSSILFPIVSFSFYPAQALSSPFPSQCLVYLTFSQDSAPPPPPPPPPPTLLTSPSVSHFMR